MKKVINQSISKIHRWKHQVGRIQENGNLLQDTGVICIPKEESGHGLLNTACIFRCCSKDYIAVEATM